MQPIHFAGSAWRPAFHRYDLNYSLCLQLVVEATGDEGPVATVAHEDWLCMDGEVLLKCYSENEGLLEALVAAGVVQEPHVHLDISGRLSRVPGRADAVIYCAVCRLTPAARAMVDEMDAAEVSTE